MPLRNTLTCNSRNFQNELSECPLTHAKPQTFHGQIKKQQLCSGFGEAHRQQVAKF